LAVRAGKDDVIRLHIERIDRHHVWPWGDVAAIASVLRALALLHELTAPELATIVADWDYEQELEQRAVELLDAVLHHRSRLESAGIDVRLHTLRRVAHHLPRWRRELWRYAPLGRTVIHGDVHSGNVLLGRGKAVDLDSCEAPILIDWERARLGCPLEDVSSWLQSLAFWEPEARRRHDTLLGEYLRLRGLKSTPSRTVRDLYWLAAASNCLSGSLLYHVERAVSPDLREERPAALRAVRDQLRILRRVEARWG
jgi:Ser/Thr protein kinase RdoA (MazF antagonist)